MEDLTKHQLILLVLLITFVTSIATGIITFSLLQEAPVEMTQTINRVVEKTIEKVVPMEGNQEKTTTTVVVSEEDRVLDAVSQNEKSIVRLKTTGSDGSDTVAGFGVVISNSGIIVIDSRSYSASSSYRIAFSDGKVFPVGKVFIDEADGLVFIKASVPESDAGYAFSLAKLGDSDTLKAGQTIIAVSGGDSDAVSIGRIFQLAFTEDKKSIKNIFSDIKVSKSNPGSPILNLSGDVVGMEAPLAESDSQYSYIPINFIKTASIKALQELNK